MEGSAIDVVQLGRDAVNSVLLGVAVVADCREREVGEEGFEVVNLATKVS